MANSVLITGASSGMGSKLAEVYAKKGYDLFLIARRLDRLNQVRDLILKDNPDVKIYLICGDVTQSEVLIRELSLYQEELKDLSVVICNAGYVEREVAYQDLVSLHRKQFETNFFGVLNTIEITLDYIKKNKGSIGVIGSVAGVIPFPRLSPYATSKAALHTLALNLSIYFSNFGISLTLVEPGFVESEIHRSPSRIKKWLMLSTESAALKIERAIRKKRSICIFPMHAKLIYFGSWFLNCPLVFILKKTKKWR